MSASRLPNLNTSLARMFSRTPSSSSVSNERAFRRIHSLARRNFPEGIDADRKATDERLSRAIAADALFALGDYDGRSSTEWYAESIRRSVAWLSLAHPELIDEEEALKLSHLGISSCDDALCVLMSCVAICSQGVPVRSNARFGLDQYRHFLRTGRLDPVALGPSGSSVLDNLKRFNLLLELSGDRVDIVRRLLSSRFTAREFREMARQNGIDLSLKERLDGIVQGSILYGPKIGSFYQNLVGNEDTLTIDMWLMRTWGRLTGTLMNDHMPAALYVRLSESLTGDDPVSRSILDTVIQGPERDVIPSMTASEVALLAHRLVNAWNRWRRISIENGSIDAEEAARIKNAWKWPLAAQSVSGHFLMPIDSPRSIGERERMRTVFGRALVHLRTHGVEMTMAQLQATLWYPEKHLVSYLCGRDEPAINVSFDEAFHEILVEEGYVPSPSEPQQSIPEASAFASR